MQKRCEWARSEDMHAYHDNEWGVPLHNDTALFEFLVLEGAQAGLSWATILKRRAGYERTYKNFNVKKVAKFTPKDVENLMQDTGIIRNRLKIECSITNAQNFINIQKEFGSFDNYIWEFVNFKPIQNKNKSLKDFVATSEISDKLSKDMRNRGFKFVGSTIMYAHMQATGMVNDHEISCFRYKEVAKLS